MVALTTAAGCAATPPTWHQDVAPIVAEHCMPCHRGGGIAPFSLTDVDSVREQSHRMIEQIERGAMPPFSARNDPDCTLRFGLVGDPRLSGPEKATLQQWIATGYLVGDPVEPPPIKSYELTDVSASLMPVAGWAASGERDQYICYVFDIGNTEMAWLSGLQVHPGNAAIVHHALIYTLAPDVAEPLVTEHGVGVPFECNSGLPADYEIHAWFPGNQPLDLPRGMAMAIVPGSKIAMQLHYHPHGGAYAPDKTALDVRFSPTRPEQLYIAASFGNETGAPGLLPGPGDSEDGVPEFLIPSNVPDHPEHMRIPVPDFEHGPDLRLVSVVPHMHFLGTRLSVTLERPRPRGLDPQAECIANGGWNFDWQRTYTLAAPFDLLPTIAKGDIVDIKCTWNNTLDNPFLPRLLSDIHRGAPFDVTFGEQTTNEMCLTIMGIAMPTPRNLSAEDVAQIQRRARR